LYNPELVRKSIAAPDLDWRAIIRFATFQVKAHILLGRDAYSSASLNQPGLRGLIEAIPDLNLVAIKHPTSVQVHALRCLSDTASEVNRPQLGVETPFLLILPIAIPNLQRCATLHATCVDALIPICGRCDLVRAIHKPPFLALVAIALP
jgi:hypothetical protein